MGDRRAGGSGGPALAGPTPAAAAPVTVRAGVAAPAQLPPEVKRGRHNSYRVKLPGDDGTRHPGPATIKLVNLRPLTLAVAAPFRTASAAYCLNMFETASGDLVGAAQIGGADRAGYGVAPPSMTRNGVPWAPICWASHWSFSTWLW
jgi:hypothetical protein